MTHRAALCYCREKKICRNPRGCESFLHGAKVLMLKHRPCMDKSMWTSDVWQYHSLHSCVFSQQMFSLAADVAPALWSAALMWDDESRLTVEVQVLPIWGGWLEGTCATQLHSLLLHHWLVCRSALCQSMWQTYWIFSNLSLFVWPFWKLMFVCLFAVTHWAHVWCFL